MKFVTRALLLVTGISLQFLHAQFHVQSPVKDAFAVPLVKILNDAPAGFTSIKGKKLTGKNDNVHHYLCNIKLPGTKEGFIDHSASGVYCRFSLGEFEKWEDAEASLINMSSLITTALQQQVLLRNADSSAELPGVEKQTRIAYVNGNGFYHFNMFVSLVHSADDGYNVWLDIKAGEPLYYYLIPRSNPVNSSYFKTAFQTNSRALENNQLKGCMVDIPGFECKQKKDDNGNTAIQYTKYLNDVPNAIFEFSNALANIKASLGHDYIFSILPTAGTILKATEFMRSSDFELKERKHIYLKLEKENSGVLKVVIDFIS